MIDSGKDEWVTLKCNVQVLSYSAGTPGRYLGRPGTCFPDEEPELELVQEVEFKNLNTSVEGVMELEDFLALFAEEEGIPVPGAEDRLLDYMYDYCIQAAEEARIDAVLSNREY